jgi:putative N6-adenine-specific DNA methylase
MPSYQVFVGQRLRAIVRLLYRVNLWARLPFRILMKLGEFPCKDAEDLYRGIQTIDWSLYLTPDMTLAVNATGKSEQLNHTHFTALQVKTAIVEQQQETVGDRSDVELQSPDVQISVISIAMCVPLALIVPAKVCTVEGIVLLWVLHP